MLALISIVLLNHYSKGSLFSVAVIFSTAPIVVYLISYPITFLGVHKELLPNPRLFKSSYLKSLFSIGVLFFLLQISGIVLFAISNITISHLFGPDQVTPYNITYRYFSLAIMCMGIISSPMWSATTDARERGDIQWIRHSIEQIKKILFLSLPVLLIMTLVSPFVFSIWVRGVKIPFLLSVLMSFYAFIIMWSSSISNFLNGMGKLNLQISNTVTAALVFIPLCIVAGHNLGINGIVISMIIVNSLGAIINTIQLNKIVKGEASGIWNK